MRAPLGPSVAVFALVAAAHNAHAQTWDDISAVYDQAFNPPRMRRGLLDRASEDWARHRTLGLRATLRVGDEVLAGAGVQGRVHATQRLAFGLYCDNSFGSVHGALRHDHEIGASVQYALVSGPRWSVFPVLGASATLARVEAR